MHAMYSTRFLLASLCWLAVGPALGAGASDPTCTGAPLPGVGGKNVRAWKLTDGSIAAFSGMKIHIDGYGRAYHPRNRDAGAVLHLCVGGKVWLPDGTSYEGRRATPPAPANS